MKKHQLEIAPVGIAPVGIAPVGIASIIIASLALGCSSSPSAGDGSDPSGITLITSAGTGTATAPTGDASADETQGSADGTAGPEGEGGIKYDVGIEGYCQIHGAGIHCDGNNAIECGLDGQTIGGEACGAKICVEGTGCVVCTEGQYSCMGDKVMTCNTAVDPAAWELVEVCMPSAGEGCDLALGACEVLEPIGTTTPTGEYFQFADFTTGNSPFQGGYDVDSHGNRIYVLGSGGVIQVYEVELLDSDGDGKFEPNQHPDNPDEPGEIEQRVLTYIENLPQFGTPQQSVSEIYATDDRIYISGTQITEYVFATGATQVISVAPGGWLGRFSQLGYDDVRDVWYGSNEQQRRVFQYDSAGNAWGIAFLYPSLSGDHMDGLEVVTDPNTNIPYVYVSDMTSDFIGQYRLDPELGWVQHNLFSYSGTQGALLEGMGYGALYHFWATSGQSLYEVGGGDLAEFTEPPG